MFLMLAPSCGSNEAKGTNLEAPPVPLQQDPEQMPSLGQLLPPPSELARTVSAPPVDALRYRGGSNWSNLLPSANVFVSQFQPNWPAGGYKLSNAAYAGYLFFGLEEYADQPRVRVSWYDPQPAPQDAWLALANFERDRWNWFALDADGDVSLPEIAPYIAPDGRVFAEVLLLGSSTHSLSHILLGSNTTPVVSINTDLNSDPLQNLGPLTVNIDCSFSYSFDGQITGFDFDFDGDGTYDLLDQPSGITSHHYQPGNYTLRVQAHEESGKSGTGEKSFVLIDPANSPPTAVINASVGSGEAPLSVDFDALGSSDSDGYITTYEYDFDSDGTYDLVTDDPAAVTRVLTRIGINAVKLRVTDNFLATATESVNLALSSGWFIQQLDSPVQLSGRMAMGISGEGATAYPCLAYVESSGKTLYFRRAGDQLGFNWPTTSLPAPLEDRYSSAAGLDVAYSLVNHAVMLCYTVYDSGLSRHMLYTVSAKTDAGTTWFDPSLAYGDENTGTRCSLAIINGVPALSSVRRPAADGNELVYILANDALGVGWKTPVLVREGSTSSQYHGVKLMPTANGPAFPLVLCTHGSNIEESAYGIRAADAGGAGWELPDLLGGGSILDIDAAMVDGRPAVACGSPYQNGMLYFARAGDANGQSWGGTLQQIGTGGHASLGIWGGRPCVLFFDGTARDLCIVRASDAQGSAWDEPFSVYTPHNGGTYCDMAVVNDTPVIAFYEEHELAIYCAFWSS